LLDLLCSALKTLGRSLVSGGKAEELEQSQGAQNFESSPAIQQWMLHRYTLVG